MPNLGARSCPPRAICVCLRPGPAVESKDVGKVEEVLLDEVEADVYWCLTKLLDNIQVRLATKRPLIRPRSGRGLLILHICTPPPRPPPLPPRCSMRTFFRRFWRRKATGSKRGCVRRARAFPGDGL